MDILLLVFGVGLLVGLTIWLTVDVNKLTDEYDEVKVYPYQIKKTRRGRYRVNVFNDEGRSILVTSGHGKLTRQEVVELIEGLETAVFVDRSEQPEQDEYEVIDDD